MAGRETFEESERVIDRHASGLGQAFDQARGVAGRFGVSHRLEEAIAAVQRRKGFDPEGHEWSVSEGVKVGSNYRTTRTVTPSPSRKRES